MEKDLASGLVKLDINDLLACLNEQPVEIKKEFDSFVKKTVTQRRQNSSIIALRDLHNWIKRSLINFAAKKDASLLDIAVGRGGDIDKWDKAGIKKVFGFDINSESINSADPFNPGARYRLAHFNKLKTKVEFEVGNAMRPTIPLLNAIDSFNTKYDIVSCQFAMHYFFAQRSDLDIVLTLVKKYLEKDGYFIGTILDSTKVRELMKGHKEVDKTLFRISVPKAFKKDKFGNKYFFEIKDTVDEGMYFNTTGKSEEYLVDKEEFVKIMNQYGFSPVNLNIFEKYKNDNGKETMTRLFEPFIPFEKIVKFWTPKDASRKMTPEELELNSLYTTFIFKKN
jgi:mRNA (guanine-N7-)-methyltransferase